MRLTDEQIAEIIQTRRGLASEDEMWLVSLAHEVRRSRVLISQIREGIEDYAQSGDASHVLARLALLGIDENQRD